MMAFRSIRAYSVGQRVSRLLTSRLMTAAAQAQKAPSVIADLGIWTLQMLLIKMLIDQFSDILARMKQDLKAAMKAKDRDAAQTIKSVLSDITYSEKGSNQPTSVVAIVRKAIKKRQDSQKAYQDASRMDLAEQEGNEINLLGKYLPQQMNDQDIETVLQEIIDQLNLTQSKEMGKLMKEAYLRLEDSVAPRQTVAQLAKKLLSK